MTKPVLTQSRLQAGIWRASLAEAGAEQPDITASHNATALDNLRWSAGDQAGVWHLEIVIPAAILSDGLQTIVLRLPDGTTIGSLAILSGEALADDLRAEIGLLRAELDILKAAFRRSRS